MEFQIKNIWYYYRALDITAIIQNFNVVEMSMERKWGKGTVSGRLGLKLLPDSPYSTEGGRSLEPTAAQGTDHTSQPPMASGPCAASGESPFIGGRCSFPVILLSSLVFFLLAEKWTGRCACKQPSRDWRAHVAGQGERDWVPLRCKSSHQLRTACIQTFTCSRKKLLHSL